MIINSTLILHPSLHSTGGEIIIESLKRGAFESLEDHIADGREWVVHFAELGVWQQPSNGSMHYQLDVNVTLLNEEDARIGDVVHRGAFDTDDHFHVSPLGKYYERDKDGWKRIE